MGRGYASLDLSPRWWDPTNFRRTEKDPDMTHRIIATTMTLCLVAVLSVPASTIGETGFDPKYERDYNIFNPANQYRPDNPLNPAERFDPNNPFNPVNRFDPNNPANPVNKFNSNNPFNPTNQYNPQNPLNPANRFNPETPFEPLH